MNIKIPDYCLVLLIGASSSGKTTFAKRFFKPSEILSSDYCRYLISDDFSDERVTQYATDVLHNIADKRLLLKKLTVVDNPNILEEERRELLELARVNNCLSVAIVLNIPDQVIFQRNKLRADKYLDEDKIKYQITQLQFSLDNLKKEGFNYVYILNSIQEVSGSRVYQNPLYCDKHNEKGPFDIIGDVHGCYDELVLLLKKLGYTVDKYRVTAPKGRKLIFLGDLVDRGPKIVEVLKLVMSMVQDDVALCVPGNHDNKLYRKLNGSNVQVKNGLEDSVMQLEGESPDFIEKVRRFLKYLESHYVLDEGKLVVCHAGIKEEYIGRSSKTVKSFTLYGETTGETDEFGLPIRYLWANDYKGKPLILYGHTPNFEPFIMNNTINIDTGCVFGNKLTCYRYPEDSFVSVDALRQYSIPKRPMI